MLVYRVFPHLPDARDDEPGHPLYVHPDQGPGRWDNPGRYRAMYVASSPSAAIGETFANLTVWTRAMLPVPTLPGAARSLASYLLDEEAHPFLNLDDAKTLLVQPVEFPQDRPPRQPCPAAVHRVETLPGQPGLLDAADRLAKHLDTDMR